MNLLGSWIFSIFKVPAVSCDARRNIIRGNYFKWKAPYYGHVRSGRDTTFSIPDLKTALLSTTASIIKAGLHEVWRKPGSQVPFPLQKDNEKQPEQGIIKPVETFGRIPQPKITPTLHPLPQSGQPCIPADPSLLFLPLRNICDPFSLAEDTVLLPPPPEPTLPSPWIPTDHIVPCSPLFPGPTQSSTSNIRALSPLSISLSLSPLAAPPPSELVIKIAGPEGYLNADDHKTKITTHIQATDSTNSLVVIWKLSHIDSGERGLMSLKDLFAQLDEKVLDSDRTALSSFNKVSITIPDLVEDVAPYDDLLQPVNEDDSIDLANATDLLEFAWHGDFVIFASKFKNISFTTLTSLTVKSSNISIGDATTLLYLCSGLQTVKLGTIRSEKDYDAIMKLSGVERPGKRRKALPNLTYLALESDVALHPLIRRFFWTSQVTINLTLRKQGITSLVQALGDSGSQEKRCPYLAHLLTLKS